MTWWVRTLGLLVLLPTLGCAGGISQQARSQVTYRGSFSELQRNVDQYDGKIVMLGGKVIETQSSQAGSDITVLQLPLDWRGRPEDSDRTEGRYLIRSGEFFDAAIYEKGTLLTVVGRLTGSEARSIGEFQYLYPVVGVIELKHWARGEGTFPSFHFGVGVGTSF